MCLQHGLEGEAAANVAALKLPKSCPGCACRSADRATRLCGSGVCATWGSRTRDERTDRRRTGRVIAQPETVPSNRSVGRSQRKSEREVRIKASRHSASEPVARLRVVQALFTFCGDLLARETSVATASSSGPRSCSRLPPSGAAALRCWSAFSTRSMTARMCWSAANRSGDCAACCTWRPRSRPARSNRTRLLRRACRGPRGSGTASNVSERIQSRHPHHHALLVGVPPQARPCRHRSASATSKAKRCSSAYSTKGMRSVDSLARVGIRRALRGEGTRERARDVVCPGSLCASRGPRGWRSHCRHTRSAGAVAPSRLSITALRRGRLVDEQLAQRIHLHLELLPHASDQIPSCVWKYSATRWRRFDSSTGGRILSALEAERGRHFAPVVWPPVILAMAVRP